MKSFDLLLNLFRFNKITCLYITPYGVMLAWINSLKC